MEGIENRFARHRRLREMTHAFVADLPGFDFFAPEGYRSLTLTGVLAPEGWTLSKSYNFV